MPRDLTTQKFECTQCSAEYRVTPNCGYDAMTLRSKDRFTCWLCNQLTVAPDIVEKQ